MARARQIKPTFFMHEVVAGLPAMVRLYWIGLWTLADRSGRVDFRPMRVKAQIFPYEDFNVEEATLLLESKGFAQRCKFENGLTVLYICNWEKHQRPHQNESQSELPPMDEALAPLEQALVLEPCILNLEPRTLNLEPVSPEPVRKRPVEAKVPDTLEGILGGGKGTPTWEAYWKVAGVFGPGKNPAPKTTAALYVKATIEFSHEHMFQKAQAMARTVSEQKYLPQLAKWLEGEGYRNPDQPAPGAQHGPSQQHRHSDRDQNLIDQLAGQVRPVAAGPSDAELDEVFNMRN